MWEPLTPPNKYAPDKARAPVTLTLSRGGKQTQRLAIAVRVALLPAAELAWWRHEAAVAVAEGSGEHAGKLRVAPGGPWQLTKRRMQKGRVYAPQLLIPAPAGVPPNGMPPQDVQWETDGDALIVTLPNWARPSASQTGTQQAGDEVRSPRPAALPPARPSALPATAAPLPARPEDYDVILKWAVTNGCGSIAEGFDLHAVNRRRVEMGEHPWVIRRRAGAFASARSVA